MAAVPIELGSDPAPPVGPVFLPLPPAPANRAPTRQGLLLSRTMLSNHGLPYVGRFACDWRRLSTTDPHTATRSECRPGCELRRPGAVRAAATAWTSVAPVARSVRAAAVTVAPLVTTSSTRRTRGGDGRAGWKAGPARRTSRDWPVWGLPGGRRRSWRQGTWSRRARARASSSAWSKPRCRRRAAVVGAHVTTSMRGGVGHEGLQPLGQERERRAGVAVLQPGHELAPGPVVGEESPARVDAGRWKEGGRRSELRRARRARRRPQRATDGTRSGEEHAAEGYGGGRTVTDQTPSVQRPTRWVRSCTLDPRRTLRVCNRVG